MGSIIFEIVVNKSRDALGASLLLCFAVGGAVFVMQTVVEPPNS